MAKEDGYIDVGGFVVETGKVLSEKKQKKYLKLIKKFLKMPLTKFWMKYLACLQIKN